eukprot:5192080-Lingulodinium_polyedra.AAC.1
MVTGGWAGFSLPAARPVVRAPVLPTAGQFISAPPEPGAFSLASKTLRFYGLPTSLSEKEVHAAVETYGRVDIAFLCLEPCEADPDMEQMVVYVLYADMDIAEWAVHEVNGKLLGHLPHKVFVRFVAKALP